MSYRNSSNHTKKLDIPEFVPVGAVIGKGGSYCKSLREAHGVRCSVDGNDRKVTLKGPRSGVSDAENELAKLFKTFAIQSNEPARVFEVVARNGPNQLWAFKEIDGDVSDAQVEEYRYRLEQSGRVAAAANENESWIQEFREGDTTNVMAYLKEMSFDQPPKIKLAFGKLCFKLRSTRLIGSSTSWPNLQKLRNLNDFSSRWSNVCDRTSPAITTLLDDLEDWMEKGMVPRSSLSVHVGEKLGKSWDLKYHLVGGEWQLQCAYTRRTVRGTYDAILDNDTSFRVRALTREKLSDNAADDIHRHLAISILGDNFFDTTVSMKGTAPTEMFIKSFDAKSKINVEHGGLHFSIFYLDQRQSDFRLECRLSTKEKEKLSAEDNASQVLVEKEPLQRVAFGSCNDQSFPQPMWPNISAHEPELWVWMGDNIYADMKELGESRPFSFPPKKIKLLANQDYAAFVNRTPVIGIWDDHDYGINDGGKHYKYREESQQVFLDFMGEPKDSPRRKQEGIYTSYTVGKAEQTVKFILVDNRYNRDNYNVKNGDFLGAAQWEWLENELMTSTAAFNVIVSGVQILPGDRYPVAECWGRFPSERERLLKLILESNAKGVILLSGDVHFSEINQVVCSNGANTITEITSSGMTHSWMEFHVPSMKYIMALLFTYANLVMPWEFRPSQDSFYGYLNWGSIDFDWDHEPYPIAMVRVRGKDDQVKLQYTFKSTPFHSDSPEQDAIDIPVSAFVFVWLVWFFIKKILFPSSSKLQVDIKKTQ
ncbi:hypothetical protein BBO99_00000899 [Phytophthora kernoviae]|uniref:K Homology domain-containing protein n=2 Tax=Phytophthora kernoviae TaxID=325452 RepID=A0A3R7JZC6_9STRA|nr:hypothetical protein G195_002444 [Phytophthora kernoviae 00238/432]KAG2531648.1 hypothetical protein JM16_000771 [Phytophthora kernoviae]RLN37693.1 hypothetical protein BBI17_000801 [Phytophthora kernoviae]RLN84905.1 hypothetical protein BBO99_00000899 [Phytophthora kernoviae]